MSIPRGIVRLLCISAVALSLTAACAFLIKPMTSDDPNYGTEDGYGPEGGDHHRYRAMAEGDALSYPYAPYNRRVLTPLIVKALPLAAEEGFYALTFLSVAATGVALFYALSRMGLGGALSLAGMFTFFSLGWGPKFFLRDFWLIDPLSFLLLALCVWAVAARRDALFAALLVLAALNKEAGIFALALFYGLRATGPLDFRVMGRTVLVGLPALLVLIGLRLGIPDVEPHYYSVLLMEVVPKRLEEMTFPEAFGEYYLWTFGLVGGLLPLLSLASKEGRRMAVRLLPFVLLVYVQLLFAQDTGRLLVFAFPAVAILLALGLKVLAKVAWVREVYLVPLPLVMFAAELRKGGTDANLDLQALLLALYLVAVFVAGRLFGRDVREAHDKLEDQ
jgi:hypothetical protein